MHSFLTYLPFSNTSAFWEAYAEIKMNKKGIGNKARQSRFPTIIIMDEVLSNEGFYHMGMIYPGQFPIKSLMLYGEELVIDAE